MVVIRLQKYVFFPSGQSVSAFFRLFSPFSAVRGGKRRKRGGATLTYLTSCNILSLGLKRQSQALERLSQGANFCSQGLERQSQGANFRSLGAKFCSLGLKTLKLRKNREGETLAGLSLFL